MKAALRESFVPVMWMYDGLAGRVIGWTKQHGNTNDDPAHLVYVVDATGKEVARASGEAESPGSFVKWLGEARRAFEKTRKRGVAHRFEAPAAGTDPLVAGETARVVWLAADWAEGDGADVKAAATRTRSLADGHLASRKLEGSLDGFALLRVDAAHAYDGAAAGKDVLAHLPRLVFVGSAPASGDPVRVEIEGISLSVDAILAAAKKVAPPAK